MNALLRHLLGILQRQVKRPRLTTGDRLGLLFWQISDHTIELIQRMVRENRLWGAELNGLPHSYRRAA